MNSKQTLEQRVAALLDAKDATSAQLGELIAEIYAAIDQHELDHENAMDPAKMPDADKAWQTSEAATFTATRLRALLPRLQQKYQQVTTSEAIANWLPSFQEVKAQEAALSRELAKLYPEIVEKLVDLLQRIEEHNARARSVNGSKPAAAQGDGRDCNRALGSAIASALRLPNPADPRFLSWPIPSVPIAVAAAAITPASDPRLHSASWWQVQEEDRRIVAAAKQRAAATAAAEREEQFHGVRWWKGETA